MRASITLQLTGAAPLYASPWNTLPSAHKILTRFCTYTPLPPLTVFFFLPAPALFSALILPDPLPRNCFVTSLRHALLIALFSARMRTHAYYTSVLHTHGIHAYFTRMLHMHPTHARYTRILRRCTHTHFAQTPALADTVFSYYRMCSLTIECVFLL